MLSPLGMLHPGMLLTFHLALDEHGEALVEPEVLPGGVRHKVARPGVGDLMHHHVHGTLVPSQQSGRDEREARVLHACPRV